MFLILANLATNPFKLKMYLSLYLIAHKCDVASYTHARIHAEKKTFFVVVSWKDTDRCAHTRFHAQSTRAARDASRSIWCAVAWSHWRSGLFLLGLTKNLTKKLKCVLKCKLLIGFFGINSISFKLISINFRWYLFYMKIIFFAYFEHKS